MTSGAWAQNKTKPAFEAASIKLDANLEGADVDSSPGLLRAQMTLRRYIAYAYNVRPYQVIGGLPWMDSAHYAIVAKLENPRGASPGAATPRQESDSEESQIRVALQQLLADRFQLKFHRESKDLPGYALTVAKGGLKIKEVPSGDGSDTSSHGNGTTRKLSATRVNMPAFAAYLARQLGRPVADQTLVAGYYTFTLEWTPDELKTIAASDQQQLPSLFTALQEQLGLKLESQHAAPVEILTIISAERPSEN
jgi:uncharacterized protein (TIGR03435 family)